MMGKARTWVSAHLGALFGFLPMTVPGLRSGGGPSADTLGRDGIRLLNWNVHKHVDAGWHRDFDRLLDEHRPDIVHLQEARIDTMIAVLAKRPESWCWMASPNLSMAAPGEAPSASGSPSPAADNGVGAFTAARAPLQQGVAMLSESAEPILGTRKPMLQCGLPLRGSALQLLSLNIHSLNFKLRLGGYGAQLDSLLEAARSHRGPVIFSGDFNTWSRWRMELLLQKVEAMGLKRVEFESEVPMRSWISTRSLDHVFYSPAHFKLKPASARILDGIRSSDHAPMLVDFVQ